MAKRFEFQWITTEIAKKHRRLFAWLPQESNARSDHKGNVRRFESFCKTIEFVPFQNGSEVGNGDFDTVHVPMGDVSRHFGSDVRRYLVTKKIEIDPCFSAAAFDAAEQVAIEAARGSKVDDGKGVMEGFRHGEPP